MKKNYQLVTFQIGTDIFGIDITRVDEIIKVPYITPIPRAPSYIMGITNLRGSIFPVIDTFKRFGLGERVVKKTSRLVVVKNDGKRIGIIVDKILEVLRFNEDEIEDQPAITKGVNSEFLQGVVKLRSKDGFLMMLNAETICQLKIIEDEEFKSIKSIKTTKSVVVREEHLVTFILGTEEYCINITSVKEIIRVNEIIKIPNSPEFILGLVSQRDDLLPVFDLKSKFKIESTIDDKESKRIIIIDIHNIMIGLMVDKVIGIIRTPKSKIEASPDIISDIEKEVLHGIIKLNNGKRLVMILNMEKVISYEELKEIEKNREKKESKKQQKTIQVAEDLVVVFKLEKKDYALNINQVIEINSLQEITKLPNAPNFVEGVINLRGEIHPVICLRKRVGLKPIPRAERTRVVFVILNGKKAGLIVDSVNEVFRFDKTKIDPLPEMFKTNISMEYLTGIINIPEKDRIILLLNIEKLLSDTEKKDLLNLFSLPELSFKDALKEEFITVAATTQPVFSAPKISQEVANSIVIPKIPSISKEPIVVEKTESIIDNISAIKLNKSEEKTAEIPKEVKVAKAEEETDKVKITENQSIQKRTLKRAR